MARPVKLRVSFAEDLRYLFRLKEAIEIDERWPASFRAECSTHVSRLIESLNRAKPLISDEQKQKA